jgi:hypothetical protein
VRSSVGFTDLTTALDPPHVAAVDSEFLKLMILPGAVDLLKRYEIVSLVSRRRFVDLLQKVVLEPS